MEECHLAAKPSPSAGAPPVFEIGGSVDGIGKFFPALQAARKIFRLSISVTLDGGPRVLFS